MMELFFRETGCGSPLVILHGLYGMSDNWMTLARRLGEHQRVILPDQRNHGRSPHAVPHDYPAMARDLADLFDRLGLEEVCLLGHSMGGKTALWYALLHPGRVKSLVVADIAPRSYREESSRRHHERILRAMMALDLSRYSRRQEISRALAPTIPEERVRLFLLKNLDRDRQHHFFWRLNLPVLLRHLDDILAGPEDDPALREARYEGPALFIRGGRSPYVSDHDIPLIRHYCPRAAVATLEGAGHWLHAEQPGEFLALVKDHLEKGGC